MPNYKSLVYERSTEHNYRKQHVRVELSFDDVETQEFDAILAELSARVDRELGVNTDKLERSIQELKEEKNKLESELYNLELELTTAKEKWEKAKAFLEKHSVTFPLNDIPF